MNKKKLGILGGMGPEATEILYKKIIEKTAVSGDRDHLDILIYSHATIPDRTEAILNGRQENSILVFGYTPVGQVTPSETGSRISVLPVALEPRCPVILAIFSLTDLTNAWMADLSI